MLTGCLSSKEGGTAPLVVKRTSFTLFFLIRLLDSPLYFDSSIRSFDVLFYFSSSIRSFDRSLWAADGGRGKEGKEKEKKKTPHRVLAYEGSVMIELLEELSNLEVCDVTARSLGVVTALVCCRTHTPLWAPLTGDRWSDFSSSTLPLRLNECKYAYLWLQASRCGKSSASGLGKNSPIPQLNVANWMLSPVPYNVADGVVFVTVQNCVCYQI